MPPAQLAREVEDRGFDALYFAEHSHIPTSRLTPFPGASPKRPELPDRYWHLTGQLTSMAMAAAITTDLVIGSAVTLIAQHDPIWLAKELATIDHFSGGRIELGIGFGWNREEYEAHGHDWKRRYERGRDCVGIMRSLWTDDVASWQGAELSLEPSWSYPNTVEPGGPKIMFGTATGPKALAALAEWGDGWMPILVPGLDLDASLAGIRAAFDATGRDPASLLVTAMNAPHEPAALHALAASGVQRGAFTVWPEDPDGILRDLDRFAAIADSL
jgi:probable F420-dependent oxidoreductase